MEANSSTKLTENLELNRNLLTQLEDKEKALALESARLAQLQKELEERSQRVEELEGIISAKDAQMTALKDAISAALTNFEGNGLTIEQRDGKVYVSMENKLLFETPEGPAPGVVPSSSSESSLRALEDDALSFAS